MTFWISAIVIYLLVTRILSIILLYPREKKLDYYNFFDWLCTLSHGRNKPSEVNFESWVVYFLEIAILGYFISFLIKFLLKALFAVINLRIKAQDKVVQIREQNILHKKQTLSQQDGHLSLSESGKLSIVESKSDKPFKGTAKIPVLPGKF